MEQEVAFVLLEHFKNFGSPVMIGKYSLFKTLSLRKQYSFLIYILYKM